MTFSRLWFAALFVAFAWAGPARAHGIGWQAEESATVAILFQYADGEPMAYGAVKIFSPATDEYEYQNGRSDENGYFSFRPNAPGQWKFVGDDGQGHVTSGEVAITEARLSGGAAAAAAGSRPVTQGGAQKPGAFQILLGISVLLNIALASIWRQSKRRSLSSPGIHKEPQ